MDKIKKFIGASLLSVGTVYLIGFLFFFILDITEFKKGLGYYDKFINGLAFLPMCFFIIWLMRSKFQSTFKRFQKTVFQKSKWIKEFIEGGVLSLFSLTIIWLMATAFDVSSFTHWSFDFSAQDTIIKNIIFYWIFGNLLAVIGEEIIYRGFLLNYLDKLFSGSFLPLILSAFVFSAAHPQYHYVLQYLMAFTGALVLGYAYQKFHSIYLPIGIHFTYNLIELFTASVISKDQVIPIMLDINFFAISARIGDWMDPFKIVASLLILSYLIVKKYFMIKPQTISSITIKELK